MSDDYSATALIERHNLNIEGVTDLVSIIDRGLKSGMLSIPGAVTSLRDGFKESLHLFHLLPEDVQAAANHDLLHASEAVLDLLDGVEAAGLDINNVPGFLAAVSELVLALIERDANAGVPEAQEALQVAKDKGLL